MIENPVRQKLQKGGSALGVMAFEFFTPCGRLNDRTSAEAVVAAALPYLSGLVWAKTRRLLLRRESFTFLDQVGERLAGLGLAWDFSQAP